MTTLEGMILCCPNEWSSKHIAVACNCSVDTVRDVYRKHGMPRPRPAVPPAQLEKREMEIRYGVGPLFWRTYKLETFKKYPEDVRDLYVRMYKQCQERRAK